MTREATPLYWAADQYAEAVASAGVHTGLGAPAVAAIDTRYADVEARLLDSAPAIVRLGAPGCTGYAVVLNSRGRSLSLLAPDLHVHRVDVARVAERLCEALTGPLVPAIDGLLAAAGVSAPRLPAARRALLAQQLGARPVEGIEQLRLPPTASLGQELRRAAIGRRLATFLAAHCVQYGLWLVSWWMIGRAALEGRFDAGWFWGWALLLGSAVPFRLLATWAQGTLAIEAGSVLKKKLLDAALRLDAQAVRGQGAGTFIGRVIEAEAVESLALSGGTLAITATIELGAAVLVLAFAAAGAALPLLLLGWTAVVFGFGGLCLRRRRAWTESRVALTHDLVEKMVGHRTRLVQASRATWHAGEDGALERYVQLSRRMDGATALLLALAPRGWLLLGLAGVGLRLVGGVPPPAELAIALGGILLAHQALSRLVFGLSDLGAAVISWRQVVPMLTALVPAKTAVARLPASVADEAPRAAAGLAVRVLGAYELTFTHARRGRPVLDGVSLDVYEGDRILLEGPSGSGKSTLVSLLSGLRSPGSGVVLLRGVDQQTLGEDAWRRRVATAPQFHENHVLSESLAFNLLMGRRWPPRAEDVQHAEQLCAELGLAELVARMPAGLFEMVGESGWQLSHGERSRVFLARALLQPSEIVMLDESFAALDPATSAMALRCALARSRTLVVVAHP